MKQLLCTAFAALVCIFTLNSCSSGSVDCYSPDEVFSETHGEAPLRAFSAMYKVQKADDGNLYVSIYSIVGKHIADVKVGGYKYCNIDAPVAEDDVLRMFPSYGGKTKGMIFFYKYESENSKYEESRKWVREHREYFN